MHEVAGNLKSHDVTRLLFEISAAPTRQDATAIFEDSDWLFVNMGTKARGLIYATIEDLIREKQT